MKVITIQIPKPMTVRELLLSNDLDPTMYIVSKNDVKIDLDDKLQEGQAIKVIPIIAGG